MKKFTANKVTTNKITEERNQDFGSRFTIGVLPDAQFYSRYGTKEAGRMFTARYGSNPFNVQTRWLAEHHRELNMPFVLILGDVVDQPEVTADWEVASNAVQILDDGAINYSILPGNHDVPGAIGKREKVTDPNPFKTCFPDERAAKNETFGERVTHASADGPIESEYHVFEAKGQKYLVLALGWHAPEETLDWAQGVLDARPSLPVILSTHEVTDIDGKGTVVLSDGYGELLFEKFVRKNDQIFLTIGGHNHGAGYTVRRNDVGHDVVNILQDYQMAYQGGNGLLGVLQFDLTGNKIEMGAMSPWVAMKDRGTLNQFDELIPNSPGDNYSIDFNFKERFAGFAPEWAAGEPDDVDYVAKAKSIVTEGFIPFTLSDAARPTSPTDYPQVEGTAVHWRPGQVMVKGTSLVEGAALADGAALAEGESAPVGCVIPDIAAGNDMVRVDGHAVSGGSVSDGLVSGGARVFFSSDHHPLSSDAGSLRWSKPASKDDVNFFSTTDDAAINSETFSKGYTLEAFLKIDEAFDPDEHGWGNALIREKSAGEIEGNKAESDDGDPAQMLGVSDLQELRWFSMGVNKGCFSNWSHEVPRGEWLHVAIINDPADGPNGTVQMLVNGAPILRDGSGPLGLAQAGRWLLGTSAWEGTPTEPWFGSIGEIRIVDHLISDSEWLTARG